MINPKSILSISMQDNDAEAETVGEYLVKLMLSLWSDGEGFSSKRPFGNSGWQYEVYKALADAGVIESETDEKYGGLLDFDQNEADKLMSLAIRATW